MSLYSILGGKNTASNIVIKYAGLENKDVGRFRDAYFGIKDNKLIAAIYTRNGGGNRTCFREFFDDVDYSNSECECHGCIITNASELFDNYLYDEDDNYDCTYATMYFSILPEYIEEAEQLVKENPELLEHVSLEDRMNTFFQVLSNKNT
jgi:hypothetical protein